MKSVHRIALFWLGRKTEDLVHEGALRADGLAGTARTCPLLSIAMTLVHNSGGGCGLVLAARSGDALRHRHTEPGHAVEHRAADPGFGLLGRQCPGAQAATDEGFVAEHGGLPERAPAVADRLLPAQAPLVPDHLDVLVALTGCGARGGLRCRTLIPST